MIRTSYNILGVPGSLRAGSFNRKLIQIAKECAPPGMHVECYDDLGTLPFFNEDEEIAFGGNEAVRKLRHLVANADGLLIATPEYNQSIPGVLKNAIDWLSRPPEEYLIGKPIALVGASGGRWGTRLAQAALRQTLTATESVVMPAPSLYIRDAAGIFDDTAESGKLRQRMTAIMTAFGLWIARLKP